MAEKRTIARPYAQALFDLAVDQKRLPNWSETLRLLAAVAADPRVGQLIHNPRVPRDKLLGLFHGVCGAALDKTATALIGVLADNRRLAVLPEIAAQYEEYRAEAERVVQAEMVSAYPVDKQQEEAVAAALKARLGREVTLVCRTDPALIGGAVIRAGDLVIDGSAVGQLHRLSSALAH